MGAMKFSTWTLDRALGNHHPAPPVASLDPSSPRPAAITLFQARGSVVAVIVFHGIALLAFGFASWYTWLGSMVAFIMGGVHLCMFTKCTYITAGCLYIVGFFFDLTAVADW